MASCARRRAGPPASSLLISLFVLAGCTAETPMHRAGLSGLEVPAGWSQADPSDFAVPGRAVAAWRGPGGATLVAYETLPAPGPATASELVQELRTRLENMPELVLHHSAAYDTERGPAAWVECVAPGIGSALAPSGLGTPKTTAGDALVPTRRVSIGLPRPRATTWLVWHYPESEHLRTSPTVRATFDGLMGTTSRIEELADR